MCGSTGSETRPCKLPLIATDLEHLRSVIVRWVARKSQPTVQGSLCDFAIHWTIKRISSWVVIVRANSVTHQDHLTNVTLSLHQESPEVTFSIAIHEKNNNGDHSENLH